MLIEEEHEEMQTHMVKMQIEIIAHWCCFCQTI